MAMTLKEIQWVKDYRTRTGCSLKEAVKALHDQKPMPAEASEVERLRSQLAAAQADLERLASDSAPQLARAERAEDALAAAQARAEEAERALESMKDRDYEPIKRWVREHAPEAVRDAYAIMAKAEARADALERALRDLTDVFPEDVDWPEMECARALLSPSAPSPREGAESENPIASAEAWRQAHASADRQLVELRARVEALAEWAGGLYAWTEVTGEEIARRVRSLLASPSAPTPEVKP